jgi:hypothetical protein
MTLEWLSYLRSLLQEVNAKQLLSAIAERSRELPPQIAQDLKQTLEKIRTGQLLNISERTAEIIVLISVTLLISNLAMPDAAFAKGSVGYARGSSGGSSTCDYDQYGNPINCDSGGSGFGVLGAIGFFGGLLWLINLYNRKDD